MDEVLVKDLLVRGVIGVTDRERENPQDILVNLVLYADIRLAGQTDDVDRSVNYRTVAKKVFAFVEHAARYTVEALATDIASICLKEPHVQGVRVRVEKPGAVRFSRSVGVEIVRWLEEEKKQPAQVFLLLGSNIEPEKNLSLAVKELGERLKIYGISSVWQSEAVGGKGPDFLNACVWAATPFSLDNLKQEVLMPIEEQLGRVRTDDKYAPRTIDIDPIIFAGEVVDNHLWDTAFITLPVAELYPNLLRSESGPSLRETANQMRTTSGARRKDGFHLPTS